MDVAKIIQWRRSLASTHKFISKNNALTVEGCTQIPLLKIPKDLVEERCERLKYFVFESIDVVEVTLSIGSKLTLIVKDRYDKITVQSTNERDCLKDIRNLIWHCYRFWDITSLKDERAYYNQLGEDGNDIVEAITKELDISFTPTFKHWLDRQKSDIPRWFIAKIPNLSSKERVSLARYIRSMSVVKWNKHDILVTSTREGISIWIIS